MACETEDHRISRTADVGEVMKLDKLLKIIEATVKRWLDKKPTGKMDIEIHARDGGISKVYKDEREEVRE